MSKTNQPAVNVKDKSLYLWAGLAIAIYAILSLLAPTETSSERFQLSYLQIQLLKLTIIVPVALIWWAAAYGVTRLKAYAATIKDAPDGRAFSFLGQGLWVLVIGLYVAGVAGQIRVFLRGTDLGPLSTIIVNYLNVVFPLVAFWLILMGSIRLARLVRQDDGVDWGLFSVIPLVILLAVPYISMYFSNPNRQEKITEGVTNATYYLPDALVIPTIVIPYVIIWAMGLAAAILTLRYAANVKGLIYRQAFKAVGTGIFLIVVTSILIQFLSTLSGALASTGLGSILILLYILLLVYGAGYIKIALGAKRLHKIEEVT